MMFKRKSLTLMNQGFSKNTHEINLNQLKINLFFVHNLKNWSDIYL
jgi:hypothetical protein